MAVWRVWGRYALAAAVSAAIGWVAFGAGWPVPVLDLFDLGVHEAGHLVTALMPPMMMFLAGSVAQVAVPVALGAHFLFGRGEWASAGFCLAWAGTSARDVAVYVADAPTQALPLIGGGTHDWAYLLGPSGFDSMDRAGAIAGFVEVIGLLLVVGGLAVCLRPLASRLRGRRAVPATAPAPPTRPRAAVSAADPSGDPWLAAAGRLAEDQVS